MEGKITLENKTLQAALFYAEKMGMSIIPVGKNKRPLLDWTICQTQKASSSLIKSWWDKWPNAMIGMVTGKISGIVVVDIDNIIQAGAVMTELGILGDQGTPSEYPFTITPRGGRHVFFLYPGFPMGNNAKTVPGADFRGDGGYVVLPPSQNDNGKFYRWGERSIVKYPPKPLPIPYIEYCKKNGRYGTSDAFKQTETTEANIDNTRKLFQEGSRDEDLFHVANRLLRSGMPEQQTREVIRNLAKACNPPFSEAEANTKVDSAIKRSLVRDRNISEEVRFWVGQIDGYFDVTDFYRDMMIVTADQKSAAITAFQRLVSDGVLEKHGQRRGVYRRVEGDCDAIDFVNAKDETIPVRWPLEVESWASVYPGNIIMVAGEKDAGKTALFLNFVRMNMERYDIHYFSSEMGAIEFKTRLSKFSDIGLRDWRFFPKERVGNFEDVIKPDAINIIDFLEIYDEFYKVGLYIKKIFDKLRTGIAIIGIQKNPGTDFGLGGMRSIEKARLYLALSNGRLKIVSGKNWRTEANPVGLVRDFKLVAGCKFIPTTDWFREDS